MQFCNFIEFKSENDDRKLYRGQTQTQISHTSTTAQGRGLDKDFESLLSLIVTQKRTESHRHQKAEQ